MTDKPDVAKHYDAVAENYHLQYERDLLDDLSQEYAANYFRMHLLLNSFTNNNIKRVVEIGVGEGTPLVSLAKAGMDVSGIDISEPMVEKAKSNFAKNGLDENRIIWGDIQDPLTYAPILNAGKYDGLLAMGVLPHVPNDEYVLKNMKTMVRPGGRVFIEFRNKLFSLFTFNRYTYEFIMDDLLADVHPDLKAAVADAIRPRLEMDKPPSRMTVQSNENKEGSPPGYDAILSKFHNPFEVLDLFKKCGFEESNLLWYHYHPAMPFLDEQNPRLFREEAMKMEHETSGWRGLFLCSAFVVEARVGDS